MQKGSCRYIPPGDQRFACHSEPVISTGVSVTERNSRREDKQGKKWLNRVYQKVVLRMGKANVTCFF